MIIISFRVTVLTKSFVIGFRFWYLEDIMRNIRKLDRRKTIPPEFCQSVLDNIQFLHFSMKFTIIKDSQLNPIVKIRFNLNDFVS